MAIPSLIDIKPSVKIQAVRPGDVVKVSQKFKEGDKEKFQSFQGVVIRVKQGKNNSSFTVRRVAHGVGVERIFFFASPGLEKVEVVKQAKVRRARLYYLRKLSGSASRLKERRRERVIAEEIAPVEAETPEEAILSAQPAQPVQATQPPQAAQPAQLSQPVAEENKPAA